MPEQTKGLSRRRLIAGAGGGAAVGAAAGFLGGRAVSPAEAAATDGLDLSRAYDFYTGDHQVGIATPPQRHLVFMSLDVVEGTTAEQLKVLFARWSAAMATMMKGNPVGSVEPSRSNGVPQDTGEAYDLSPASLTVTLGLGPGLFDDRFGLAGKGPKLLAEIPRLPADELKPELCGGDLALQACADDPQVAYHAVRALTRIGRGLVTTRWTVLGFGRASAGKGQKTPRNLMGLKDGTRNIRTDEELDEFVWVTDPDEPAWMQGGSYLVTRKINMDIEVWDGTTVETQHTTIGRDKSEGAPLSGKKEFDTPDFTAVRHGKPVIDPTSHVALAASENNDGAKILRRGYNFTDGLNSLGQLDAGLFFIAFQKDPATFVDLQRKLGRVDLLNEYIAHVGSAIFAVPRAPKTGHFLAEELFG